MPGVPTHHQDLLTRIWGWIIGGAAIAAAFVTGLFSNRNTDKQTASTDKQTEAKMTEIADARIALVIESQKTLIDELRQSNAEKDSHIARLEALDISKDLQISRLEELLKAKDNRINKLIDSVREMTNKLRCERRANRGLRKEIATMSDRLSVIEDDKARLQAQLDALTSSSG